MKKVFNLAVFALFSIVMFNVSQLHGASAALQKRVAEIEDGWNALQRGLSAVNSAMDNQALQNTLKQLPLIGFGVSPQGGSVPSIELSALAVTAGVVRDDLEKNTEHMKKLAAFMNNSAVVNLTSISQSPMLKITDANRESVLSALNALKQ